MDLLTQLEEATDTSLTAVCEELKSEFVRL